MVAVFSVPESERAHRHTLRSRLSWLGFGNAAPGVWLAPARVLPDARRLLERLGLDAYVHLFLSAEYAGFTDLRTAVAAWWDFPAIEGQYAEFTDTWRPVLAARSGPVGPGPGPDNPDPAEAFRDYVPMLTQWRRLPYLDPGLPAPLLPPDWNAVAARAVFTGLHTLLAGPSLRHVEEVTGLVTAAAHHRQEP